MFNLCQTKCKYLQEAHRGGNHKSRTNERDGGEAGGRHERHRRKKRSERPTSLTHQKMQDDYEDGNMNYVKTID